MAGGLVGGRERLAGGICRCREELRLAGGMVGFDGLKG